MTGVLHCEIGLAYRLATGLFAVALKLWAVLLFAVTPPNVLDIDKRAELLSHPIATTYADVLLFVALVVVDNYQALLTFKEIVLSRQLVEVGLLKQEVPIIRTLFL